MSIFINPFNSSHVTPQIQGLLAIIYIHKYSVCIYYTYTYSAYTCNIKCYSSEENGILAVRSQIHTVYNKSHTIDLL